MRHPYDDPTRDAQDSKERLAKAIRVAVNEAMEAVARRLDEESSHALLPWIERGHADARVRSYTLKSAAATVRTGKVTS
ncbi:hypothetical protein LCGC14_2940730 [marine sediment metagenome]|uniref:Uncharacterized protein n=1 Tax=marine sediment metagenome TaxID=412755 RepID=A0A0F8ZQU6_9ZZZZ